MVGLADLTGPSESAAAFLSHWQSLRMGDDLPTSESFLDNVRPEFQPYVSLNDVSDDRQNKVVLFGTALVELWKVDLTGKKVEEFLDADQMERLTTDLLHCAHQPCGIWEISTLRTTTNRIIGWEMVTLPLAVNDPGRHRIVRYHNMAEPAQKGELVTDILHFQKKEWLDTGAGVPAQAPLRLAS